MIEVRIHGSVQVYYDQIVMMDEADVNRLRGMYRSGDEQSLNEFLLEFIERRDAIDEDDPCFDSLLSDHRGSSSWWESDA